MQTITTDIAAKMLYDIPDGHIFTATFVKRNGELRKMNCRKGVKKGVTGRGMNYNPRKKLLIPVYDMQNDGWRMININTLTELKMHGNTFQVLNKQEVT